MERVAFLIKETVMEATQQSVQEIHNRGFEPEIVAFCCEF